MNSHLQSLTDEELARQTRAGSVDAFETLVARYHHRLFAFVSQTCPNQADASEITQDTFLKAFNAIDLYNPAYPFRSWLFTIARRKAIDHLRAAPPTGDNPVPDQPDHNDPAELLARHEDHQDLWRIARRHLPELHYQALWLRYAEDLDVPQIARVLRKTRTHIKVILFRARQTLARELPAPRKSDPLPGTTANSIPPSPFLCPTQRSS